MIKKLSNQGNQDNQGEIKVQTKGYKQTEVGVIPDDWKVKKIQDFTYATAGGTPSTLINEFWGGEIRWMSSGELNYKRIYDVQGRITEFGLNNSATKYIPSNSVLIGLAGQGKTRGTVAINYIKLCTNQSIAAILPNQKVDSEYLFQNLEHRYLELRNLSSGDGGRGGLNLRLIHNLKIPLPPTRTEQTAIATALSDMDSLIEGLEKLLVKKRNIKQGAMQELLTPKEGWEVRSLGDFADVTKLAGFEYSKHFNSYKDGGDIIVIRGTNITNNKLDLTDVKKIPYSTSKFLKRSKLNKFDLVFAYVGTIGPVYLITENNKYHLGPNTSKITVKKLVSSEYLLIYFKSEQLKDEINDKISVGAQPSLSMTKIRSFKINFPKNSKEQNEITQILSNMDTEISQLETQLSKYKMLKTGMMQELLTGKKRLV